MTLYLVMLTLIRTLVVNSTDFDLTSLTPSLQLCVSVPGVDALEVPDR